MAGYRSLRLPIAALACAASTIAAAARDAAPSTDATGHAAFVRAADGWAPLAYLCDGIARGAVLAITTPDRRGAARLTTYAKPGLRSMTRTVRLGGSDAGAGSVFRALLTPAGDALGAVRSINPGMLGDAAATTLPTVSSMRIGGAETRCRWLPRARLLIVTPRRSAVIVADGSGGYVYRSFDHDKPGEAIENGERGTSSTPTVMVTGGRRVAAPPGREAYRFAAGRWTYRVEASADMRAPGATITVLDRGRPSSRAAAIAYQMAAAPMRR